ncbi:MAG: SPOR domain-containing protein [Pseudomonadota bacterium]
MQKSEKTSEKKNPFKETGGKGTTTWVCVIFFVSAWMFVLGIFVGRGTSPVKFDIENLQKELAALKEAVVKEGQERFKIGSDPASAKMELGFYEALKETGPIVRHEVKNAKTRPEQEVEKSASSSKQTKAAADAGFTIQVASLKDMKVAVEMAEMLKKKGYQAYTVSAKIPGKGAWHRIRIGHFKNRSDAADTLEKLKKDKYRPIIIQE